MKERCGTGVSLNVEKIQEFIMVGSKLRNFIKIMNTLKYISNTELGHST